jgi:hypothetical protein
LKLAAVRRFALSLPEVTEQPHFDFSSFRVRGKIFVTVPPPGEYIHVFVDDLERERALALAPESIEKLWWGKKAVGLRVKLARARPTLVQELVRNAWTRKAPKRLVSVNRPGTKGVA